jgi:anaerobic selenocysteine-containing dehydrogenase
LTDPLAGAARDDIFICEEDIGRLGLRDGNTVQLTSVNGMFRGRLRSRMTPGNLAVHWPEGNVHLPGSTLDPESMEPDYNATGPPRAGAWKIAGIHRTVE